MNIIEQLEKEHMEELGKSVPEFAPGDTVKVNVKVREGERTLPRSVDASVPAALDAIVEKATARAPDARYASARATGSLCVVNANGDFSCFAPVRSESDM